MGYRPPLPAIAPCRPPTKLSCWLYFFLQRPAKDLPYVGLRQRFTEFDVSRRLVLGQVFFAISSYLLLCWAGVALDHEDLDRFSRFFVRDADGGDFQNLFVTGHHVLDLIREY